MIEIANRVLARMRSAIGRPFASATLIAGGSKAACWTQLASIAARSGPCAAVKMNTPLGTRPSGLPIR
jgi:hypothetical protein